MNDFEQIDWLRRRAADERQRAAEATTPVASVIHAALANAYELRLTRAYPASLADVSTR